MYGVYIRGDMKMLSMLKILNFLGMGKGNSSGDSNKLGDIIRNQPSILKDRARTASLLKDFFNKEKSQLNLLLAAHDEGISNTALKKDKLDDVTFTKLWKRLETNYGLTEENAQWAVVEWFKIFEVEILVSEAKEAPKSKAKASRSRKTARSADESADLYSQPVSSVAVTPVVTIPVSSKMQDLSDLFKAYFTHAPYKWHVGGSYYNDSGINNGTKMACIQAICQGKVKSDKIIHLCTDMSYSRGWALTDDAFYIVRPNYNECVKYSDITGIRESGFPSYRGKYNNKLVIIGYKDTSLQYIDRLDRLDPKWNGRPSDWYCVEGNDFWCLANFLKAARNIS